MPCNFPTSLAARSETSAPKLPLLADESPKMQNAAPNISSTNEHSQSQDIIAEIKGQYSNLSPAEQSVADAILSDVNAAVTASNAEIALRAGVSEPTVTRFCRSVGCAGVRDFKVRLTRSFVVGELFLASDKRTGQPNSDAATPFWSSIFSEAHLALREVEAQLDPKAVQQAGALIAKAGRCVVVGMGGSSASLAEETQVRLFRYGVPVSACNDPYMARMTVSTFQPGDVLIIISATGRASQLIDSVELAHHYRGHSIAITAPDSPLSDATDIALTTQVQELPDALIPSASRFAFLIIIDLIAAATGYQLGDRARENLRRIKFNMVSKASGGKLEPLGE